MKPVQTQSTGSARLVAELMAPSIVWLIFVYFTLAVADSAKAAALTDNFNDGNDDGWTRYDPLALFGAGGIFSFPTGGVEGLDYRIQAPVSPDPSGAGAARAGSLRQDLVSGAFFVSVYFHAWDNNIDQSFGPVGRISQPGLHTTDGYGTVYSTEGFFRLLRFDNDVPTILASTPLVLDPVKTYRFIFSGGFPGGLIGEIIDSSSGARIASLVEVDTTYATGSSGLIAFANTGSGTVDARFDFFQFSDVPEPSTWVLLALGSLIVGRKILLRGRNGYS